MQTRGCTWCWARSRTSHSWAQSEAPGEQLASAASTQHAAIMISPCAYCSVLFTSSCMHDLLLRHAGHGSHLRWSLVGAGAFCQQQQQLQQQASTDSEPSTCAGENCTTACDIFSASLPWPACLPQSGCSLQALSSAVRRLWCRAVSVGCCLLECCCSCCVGYDVGCVQLGAHHTHEPSAGEEQTCEVCLTLTQAQAALCCHYRLHVLDIANHMQGA